MSPFRNRRKRHANTLDRSKDGARPALRTTPAAKPPKAEGSCGCPAIESLMADAGGNEDEIAWRHFDDMPMISAEAYLTRTLKTDQHFMSCRVIVPKIEDRQYPSSAPTILANFILNRSICHGLR